MYIGKRAPEDVQSAEVLSKTAIGRKGRMTVYIVDAERLLSGVSLPLDVRASMTAMGRDLSIVLRTCAAASSLKEPFH